MVEKHLAKITYHWDMDVTLPICHATSYCCELVRYASVVQKAVFVFSQLHLSDYFIHLIP